MSRAALLGVDEVIELGQERPPESATPTELQEIRSVIDAWIARYGREVTRLVARQSRLAQETGESLFRLWLQEVGATLGIVPNPAEVWEATRLVAFRLLSVGQAFAQQYHPYFTDEQDRLLSMEMDQALKTIDTAEEFSRALRPEVLQYIERLIKGATQVLMDVSAQLADILKRVGLAAIEVPQLTFDLIKWIREHIGLVVGIGVAVVVAAFVVPPLIQASMASGRMSGTAAGPAGRLGRSAA